MHLSILSTRIPVRAPSILPTDSTLLGDIPRQGPRFRPLLSLPLFNCRLSFLDYVPVPTTLLLLGGFPGFYQKKKVSDTSLRGTAFFPQVTAPQDRVFSGSFRTIIFSLAIFY